MKLPPLNAVKAFEAAARAGSFVGAAEELGVSSAAVSLQVRKLEAFLGRRLFARNNNRIILTDAGKAIYPGTAEALNAIAGMSLRLTEGNVRSGLVVSTVGSLAERWLVPKIAAVKISLPDVAISLRIEDDPVDFRREGIDIRITYGDVFYPEYHARELFRDEVTPLAAPGFLPPAGTPDALAGIPDEHLIHVDWGASFASHPQWGDWFRLADLARHPDPAKGIRVSASSLALEMAARGVGIALGQKHLSVPDLASGRLLAPSPLTLRLAHPYFAVTPHARLRSPRVAAFLDLLADRREAAGG